MMRQDRMTRGDWAWLLIFGPYRAVYLLGGWLAVAGYVFFGAVPILGFFVHLYGLWTMHRLFGCERSLAWVAVQLVFWLAVLAVLILLFGTTTAIDRQALP